MGREVTATVSVARQMPQFQTRAGEARDRRGLWPGGKERLVSQEPRGVSTALQSLRLCLRLSKSRPLGPPSPQHSRSLGPFVILS